MPRLVSGLSGCGDGGDIIGGMEFSAKMGLWPRGQKRPGEKGEMTWGLTMSPFGGSVGSRAAGVQRIDGEGLGCPRLKTTEMTKQGLLASSSSIGRTRRFWRFF